MLGGLCTALRSAFALRGGPNDDLRARDRARACVPLVGGTAPCHRQISRGGGLVSRQRREIADLRGLVALGGGVQTRSRAVLALTRGALTDVTTEPARRPVVIRRQIATHVIAV
jgi:hypothetical protein